MFFLKLCLTTFIVGVIIFIFFKINKQKEHFDEDKTKKIKTETISDLLKKVKNEIDTNKDEWLIYNASHDKDKYVLTLNKSIEPVYTIDVSKSKDDETLYTVKGVGGKSTGVNGIQKNIGIPSSYGRFGANMAKIEYKRGKERISININSGKTTITGYGGFANDNSYPYPWYQVMPIIYKEGGSTIAIMDYSGNKKNIKSSTTYLPMEIIVNKKYEIYLPLFFKVYVLLQKYILSLQ